MADIGGFLAGLLGGFGEGYQRAGEENRRISLMKKQLENQKAIQEGQLALQSKQMDLQAELGRGGLNLDWAKLGSAEKQAAMGRAHDIYTLGIQNAMQQGNMSLASQLEQDKALFGNRLQQDNMKLGSALGSMEADRDVGRRVALTKQTSAIDDASKKGLMTYQAQLEEESATKKDARDIQSWRTQKADEFLFKILGREMDQVGSDDADMRQVRAQVQVIAAEAEAKAPGGSTRVLALLKKLGDEAETGRKGGAQTNANVIKAMQIITSEDLDPKAKLVSLMSAVGGEGAQDWSNVGKASSGPKAAGRISLAKGKETGKEAPREKFTNDLGTNIYDDQSLKDLVQRTQWLDQAANAEWKSITNKKPDAEALNSDMVGSIKRGVFGRSEPEKLEWLRATIDRAPGATLTEKLHNAVRSWSTFKRASAAIPEAPVPQPIQLPSRRG